MSKLLQAELPPIPQMQAHCVACLHANEGNLTIGCPENCQIRQVIPQNDLDCFDKEKWLLFFWPGALIDSQIALHFSPAPLLVEASAIPMAITPLDQHHLIGWTASQASLLQSIFPLVDNKRSVQEIKACVTLPAALVEETLQILIALSLIQLH